MFCAGSLEFLALHPSSELSRVMCLEFSNFECLMASFWLMGIYTPSPIIFPLSPPNSTWARPLALNAPLYSSLGLVSDIWWGIVKGFKEEQVRVLVTWFPHLLSTSSFVKPTNFMFATLGATPRWLGIARELQLDCGWPGKFVLPREV